MIIGCYTFFMKEKERVNEAGLPPHGFGRSGVYDH